MILEGCSLQFSRKNEYRRYFVERFGIAEEIMQNYSFFQRGKSVWAFTGNYLPLEDIETLGIRALRIGKGLKPSTAFLRVIGIHATRNVVELDDEQALRYMRGEDIEENFPVDFGYVIVKGGEDILGCGLYKGRLINQIPKKYRMEPTWV